MKERLVTENEFQEIIKEIINCDINNQVRIQYILKDKSENEYIYGKKGEGAPNDTKEVKLADGYKLTTSLWGDTLFLSSEKRIELFRAFWNYEFCDSVTGIPTTDRERFMDKCENTFRIWQEEDKKIAFFMMDLDNF